MTAEKAQSFDNMYAANVRPVLAYCLRRTDAAAAHDAAAEVFAVAWRRHDEMPTGSEALPWLFGVAANVLRNQRRSSRRAGNLLGKLGSHRQTLEGSPEDQVVRRSDYDEVHQAIDSLRPAYREIVKLVDWDELPREAIAQMLSISRAAVDQRVHRAYRQLERKLQHLSPHQPKGGIDDTEVTAS